MADPVAIENEITILCEGAADQNFIRRLIAVRGGFPSIDFLPPHRFHGRDGFKDMLIAIKGTGVSFERLKGILIVADSHNKPQGTLKHIQKQIQAVPNFSVPAGLGTLSAATEGHPPIAIALLPDEETAGALESLFAKELEMLNPWITECVNAFLKCDQIKAHGWPAEKHAKARYHSMVAALHKADPSRSASTTFTNKPPV